MKNVFTDKSQSDNSLDWDFYFYVGNTVLNWSIEHFWNVTPNHFLKQYIMHLKYTNPDALVEEKVIYTLDQTPFR